MKLLVVLAMCVAVMAAPNASPKIQFDEEFQKELLALDPTVPETRNFAVNLLIIQLLNIIRSFINNGSSILGVPQLDPLEIEDLHLNIPAGLINLDLQLRNAYATGFGGFVARRASSNVREISVYVDIAVPELIIRAGHYNLTGDLFTAVPLYGDGEANFVVKDFAFQAKLYLGQSEDGRSIIIDRIEAPAFQIPYFESRLTGVIGGGDIDKIVNAIVEDVIIGYVNRFQGAIALVTAHAVKTVLNPALENLDSWRFIAPFV